jgi:hypothetical protein
VCGRRRDMVWKRILASVTLLALVVSLEGCYSKYLMSRQEIAENPRSPIFTVITVDGEVLEFEPRAVLEDSSIIGTLLDGTAVRIPLDHVSKVYAKKMDDSKTIATCCAAGGITGLLAIVLLMVGLATTPGLFGS